MHDAILSPHDKLNRNGWINDNIFFNYLLNTEAFTLSKSKYTAYSIQALATPVPLLWIKMQNC